MTIGRSARRKTGGRVALPVFREVMLAIYHDGIVGPAPAFPQQMEQRITDYLHLESEPVVATVARSAIEPSPRRTCRSRRTIGSRITARPSAYDASRRGSRAARRGDAVNGSEDAYSRSRL